jgi:tetratricopeptide (TPR) repeat protein
MLLWLVVASVATIAFSGATVGAQPDPLAACRGTETSAPAIEQRIAGCSAVIASGALANEGLSEAYLDRGNAYFSKGDLDHAIGDYDQAIQLMPKSVKAYSNRGIFYMQKKDFPHAIADLDHAVSLEPNSAEITSDRGMVYLQFGYCAQAVENFQSAQKLDPKYTQGQQFFQMADQRKASGGCRPPEGGTVVPNTQSQSSPNDATALAQIESAKDLAGIWTEMIPEGEATAVYTWYVTAAADNITILWGNGQVVNFEGSMTIPSAGGSDRSYQLSVAGRDLSGVVHVSLHIPEPKCDLPDTTYPVTGRISADGKMLVIQGSFPAYTIPGPPGGPPCQWSSPSIQVHQFKR